MDRVIDVILLLLRGADAVKQLAEADEAEQARQYRLMKITIIAVIGAVILGVVLAKLQGYI